MKLYSTLKCPHCGFEREEKMPVGSCMIVYECKSCRQLVRPKAGECCVFCSYGTEKCPHKQGV